MKHLPRELGRRKERRDAAACERTGRKTGGRARDLWGAHVAWVAGAAGGVKRWFVNWRRRAGPSPKFADRV